MNKREKPYTYSFYELKTLTDLRAIERGNYLREINDVLKAGRWRHQKKVLEAKGETGGYSLIHWALARYPLEPFTTEQDIENILVAGPSLSSLNEKGLTPLFTALSNPSVELSLIQKLFSHGAQISEKLDKFNVFHFLFSNPLNQNRVDIFNWLLDEAKNLDLATDLVQGSWMGLVEQSSYFYYGFEKDGLDKHLNKRKTISYIFKRLFEEGLNVYDFEKNPNYYNNKRGDLLGKLVEKGMAEELKMLQSYGFDFENKGFDFYAWMEFFKNQENFLRNWDFQDISKEDHEQYEKMNVFFIKLYQQYKHTEIWEKEMARFPSYLEEHIPLMKDKIISQIEKMDLQKKLPEKSVIKNNKMRL